MDFAEEEDSFINKLYANMNDLVGSFWNKMMRDCGLDSWTVNDTPSHSLLDNILIAAEDPFQDDHATTANEQEVEETSVTRHATEPVELHSIDSFSDNEEFDRIFAGAGGTDLSPAIEDQMMEPDTEAVESFSGEEDCSGGAFVEDDDEQDSDHEMSSGTLPSSGNKRSYEDESDGQQWPPKHARFMGNSLSAGGRQMVGMNFIGMD